MTFCCLAVSDAHGASMSILASAATESSIRVKYWVWALRHGAMAPSLSDRSPSGMTSSGSISNVVPRPSHVGQAPYGELNEKLRGAGSSNERPSTGHTRCSLNVSTSSSTDASPSRCTISSSATPSASLSAVSRESVRRRAMPSRITRRSTTTSIVCCS